VIDNCNGSATCSFTVTVRKDTEPPKIDCPPDMTVLTCRIPGTACGAIVNYPAPVATDNSGSVAVTCTPPPGSFFPCGDTVVTCVAEDRCENKEICRFMVTVKEGGSPPGIQCPADLTLTTCSNTAVLTYPPPVVNPPGTPFICLPPPGTIVPLGVHTVTCIASNACGRMECSFKVTVRPAPQVGILCPSNQVVTLPCGSNCVPVFYPPPTVFNGALESCFPPQGTCLPEGIHVVVCRASNECGSALCEFTVRVIKGQGNPPSILCPSNQVITTCSNSAVLTYPPPTVNPPPPATTVVCLPPSGTVVGLGVHTVTCIASNDCGQSECTFTVTVRQRPQVSILCPSNQVVTLPCLSNCVPVFYPPPTVFNGTLESCFPPQGTCLPEGIHVVTCRASNECGSALCEFTVRVIKGQGNPPSILCPSNQVITTCSNTAVLTYPPPTVNPPPPATTVVCLPPSGTVVGLGVHTVTCIASNDCGRSECTFTVTVRQRPQVSILCPSNQVVTLPCGSNCVPVFYPPPTVVNGTLESCNPPQGTCLPEGIHLVTCRASNECGSAICEFTVRVIKGQGNPPSIHCPSNQVITTCSNTAVLTYPPPVVIPAGTSVTCTPPPGTVVGVGIHTVTCIASNDCGRSECSFTVRVIRTDSPPQIQCPQDVTLVTCSNCVPITYPKPVVINGTLLGCTPPPGTCLPVGTYTVKCVASNACGTATCEFRVNIIPGAEKPTLSITYDHGYIRVCWTKPCRCFKLQSTYGFPAQWVDVQQQPVDNGDSYCVRLPITGTTQFFRLVQCDRPTATVFDVTGTPITRGSAGRLADALGIPQDRLLMGDGSVRFLDPMKFQAIPTMPITDPAIIEPLSQESENDKGELSFEGLDFEKLRGLRVMGADQATDKFAAALRSAELLPANGQLKVRHTMFEAFDEKGAPMVEPMPIDTHVDFHFDLGGIPIVGPGAKLGVAFGPGGEPTSLLGTFREYKPAMEIPILPMEEAAQRCQKVYPQLGANLQPRLVYLAPNLPGVQKLIPCFDCSGEGVIGGEKVNLLGTIIPATDDPALAPQLELEAGAVGTLVNAKAMVNGGTPPYSYQWLSSSVDLGGMFPPDASSIEYNASPRDDARLELVRVVVTDANGMQVQASRAVVLGPAGLVDILFTPAVGGISDYGIERAVSDLCAGQQADFNARFMPEGYVRRFNWSGLSAWERDFKEGGTGLDHQMTDNVDLTFYMGHGYGGGFTFEGSNDDGTLHYSDAVKAWGDIDLEWMALLSCSVMADTYDGKSCVTRWGPAFDGLHLMLGFANTTYDQPGFAAVFADWTLGRFHILPPVPIRSAWLLASDGVQPSSVVASVMGVIGPGGCVNYNDYFWGKGPVGPDIRGSFIYGFWRVKL
jgi:hypothetical protein